MCAYNRYPANLLRESDPIRGMQPCSRGEFTTHVLLALKPEASPGSSKKLVMALNATNPLHQTRDTLQRAGTLAQT